MTLRNPAQQFPVFQEGDTVCWQSAAGGSLTTKTGRVLKRVPAGRRTQSLDIDFNAFVGLGSTLGGGIPRPHDSYLIAVGNRLYWPRVAHLRHALSPSDEALLLSFAPSLFAKHDLSDNHSLSPKDRQVVLSKMTRAVQGETFTRSVPPDQVDRLDFFKQIQIMKAGARVVETPYAMFFRFELTRYGAWVIAELTLKAHS